LQAIFGAASFQNESVLKVGLNWVFLGPTLWRRNSKRFHKFFSYKEVYGWETQVTNALLFKLIFCFE
jgi:hypothetical protein